MTEHGNSNATLPAMCGGRHVMADRDLFLIVKGNCWRGAGRVRERKQFNETWGFVGRQHERAVRDWFNEPANTLLFWNMSAELRALRGLAA
jgi:hypothetical protein